MEDKPKSIEEKKKSVSSRALQRLSLRRVSMMISPKEVAKSESLFAQEIEALERELEQQQKTIESKSSIEPKEDGIRIDYVSFAHLINDPEFSDITLIAEKEKILCHKVILASRCDHFKKLFETNKAAKAIKLNIRFPVLQALVEYVYTGKLTEIKKDWAEELMVAASVYQLSNLKESCEKYLGEGGTCNVPSPKNSLDRTMTLSNFETMKKREMRKRIATEILNTEKTYVSSLQVIFDEFVMPLKKADQEGHSILSRDEIMDIFNYWEVLLNCHNKLYKLLDDRMKEWEDRPEVGDIFSEQTSFIKLYKHYVNNYDKSYMTYKRCKENKKEFKEFLEKYEPQLGSLGLQAFLILPVQRIPRYVLLLKDLLKYTVPGHSDYENLQAALIIMKDLADYIDANKNDADEVTKISDLQQRIYGAPNGFELVQPKRRLIREGILYNKRDKMQSYLFNDVLLCCKLKQKNKLKFVELINLATCQFKTGDFMESTKYSFEIVSQQGTFYFVAPSSERESWIKDIGDAAEAAQKNLLGKAFEDDRLALHNGTGKQYLKVRQEESAKRRSEIALQLYQSEETYVEKLRVIVQNFLLPLREQSGTSYFVLTEEDIKLVFSNVEQILEAHVSFLSSLKNRVDHWDNEVKLGDLYLGQVSNIFKMYMQYVKNHPKAVQVLLAHTHNNSKWITFSAQKEAENKVSLCDLIELPIKLLPRYYLQLEEMKKFTLEGHPDSDDLNVAILRLKEYLEEQKDLCMGINISLGKSLSNSSSQRKKSLSSKNSSLRIHRVRTADDIAELAQPSKGKSSMNSLSKILKSKSFQSLANLSFESSN